MFGILRRIGVPVLAGIIFSSPALAVGAESSHFEQFSKECSKELVKGKTKSIVVADLIGIDGVTSEQGHYFATTLSYAVLYFEKDAFRVRDHNELHQAQMPVNLSPANITSPDVAKAITDRVHAAVVLVGTVGRDDSNYILRVSALRVSDGAPLFSKSVDLPRSEFLDSLGEPFPPTDHQSVPKKIDLTQVKPPLCDVCPIPVFTDFARRSGVEGKSVFLILISPEGKVVSMTPAQVTGFGLDERAFDTIKLWRFHPATNLAGTPVYVIVAVNVTFRKN